MKKSWIIALLLFLVAIAFFSFEAFSPEKREHDKGEVLSSLPWQIKINDNGSSTVFGQTFGVSTLRGLQQEIGRDPLIRLFRNTDGSLSLEAFFNNVMLSYIISKLIVKLELSNKELAEFEARAISRHANPAGGYELKLSVVDAQKVYSLKIATITWLPTWFRLDETIVLERFGEMAEKVTTTDSAQHWLYPKLGLDIIKNQGGRVAVQYIDPREFDQVIKSLQVDQSKRINGV